MKVSPNWEAIVDGVRNFREFRRPATLDEAVNALAGKLLEWDPEQIEAAFAGMCRVFDRSVEIVPEHAGRRRIKLHPFATRRDIDTRGCLAILTELEPLLPTEAIELMLDWVIYWHWER